MVYALAIGCGVALAAVFAAATFTALKPLWQERRRQLSIVAAMLAALTLIKFFLVPLFPATHTTFSNSSCGAR